MKLLLFDIDGTLVNTGGAGSSAMTRAFSKICGIEDAFSSLSMAGMTDPLILEHAVSEAIKVGFQVNCSHEEIYEAYLGFLSEELRSGKKSYRVLPGVVPLLQELQRHSDLSLGLATGNIARGARVKLEHGKIFHYFRFGGYGSDHGNRTHVISQAVRRGAEYVAPAQVERAIVIGDTPRDIIHAKQAGVEVVAVASGSHSRAELEKHEPDLVIDSLEERELFMEFIS